uniref:Probable glycerol kinase n=1 Tax=Plectus sambesii TaxID=2011161 RepID=A0A914XJM1_9BILA
MVLIGSIDQGTSSTRFFIFESDTAQVLFHHQIELKQSFPHNGWVEMDPKELLSTTQECIEVTCKKLVESGKSLSDVKAVGVTNQRETSIVWDKVTGEPLFNAIVWLDARTADLAEQLTKKTPNNNKDHFRSIAGLPIHPYFSALKVKWMIDNVPEVKNAVDQDRALFGNVDSWLIWKLTGGTHVTDVSNASRTLLFDIAKRQWSAELCDFFGVPMGILPKICSSAEVYGSIKDGALKDVVISGCLGDQQSALVGQNCVAAGMAKNTYGTGAFMLCNTGTDMIVSKSGLLTTVAFQLGAEEPVFYALEGSGSIGGTVVRWLRDNLGIINASDDVESLAQLVDTTSGVYFVPCFTGLYTPYWDPKARGTICGLTQFTTKEHIVRAALEASCFQTREMLDAIQQDFGKKLQLLKVDGGMTKNALLMQMQADILGFDVVRANMPEVTGWGAAVAAAIGIGALKVSDYCNRSDTSAQVFHSTSEQHTREEKLKQWKNAVQRSLAWAT